MAKGPPCYAGPSPREQSWAPRRKRFAEEFYKDPFHPYSAMAKAGFKSRGDPERLNTLLRTVENRDLIRRALIKRGVTLDKLANTIAEGLDAMKTVTSTVDGTEHSSKVKDHPTRLKAAEMGYKAHGGAYEVDENQPIGPATQRVLFLININGKSQEFGPEAIAEMVRGVNGMSKPEDQNGH